MCFEGNSGTGTKIATRPAQHKSKQMRFKSKEEINDIPLNPCVGLLPIQDRQHNHPCGNLGCSTGLRHSHLAIRSSNGVQTHIRGLDKCLASKEAELAIYPTELDMPEQQTSKVILYRKKNFLGEPASSPLLRSPTARTTSG